jgi:energy-coupling factor transporter ATP-binding protein EcfA2
MSRTIVAFIGPAGCGKSTAAAALIEQGYVRHRFAGPLKAMLRALGLTEAEVDGERKEKPCALLGGKTPREAMQSLGTDWGRKMITGDLWLRAWLDTLPTHGRIVVDDCRFPNEAAAIKSLGGVIVRVHRPGHSYSEEHASEQHHRAMAADYEISATNADDLRYMVRDIFHATNTPHVTERKAAAWAGVARRQDPDNRNAQPVADPSPPELEADRIDFDGLGGGA